MKSFHLAQVDPTELGIRAVEGAANTVVNLAEPSFMTKFLMLLPIIIAAIGLLTLIVLSILAVVQVVIRKDLQESKVLWILLLLFITPVGMIAYFFTEKRKGLGILSVIALVMIFLALPLYAIMAFMALH
jgi:hypothetical protein